MEAEMEEMQSVHRAEVEKLCTEVGRLRAELQQITQHNKCLNEANHTLEAQLHAETKQLEVVTTNVRALMHKLPPLSPFRRSLTQMLSKDMRRINALNLLEISPSTYQRAMRLDASELPLFDVLYPLNTKKKMVSDEWHDLAKSIFHEHAPVQSGYDHRIKYEDDATFYECYTKAATTLRPDLVPVSKSYYMNKV
jgi:hypothetical protein